MSKSKQTKIVTTTTSKGASAPSKGGVVTTIAVAANTRSRRKRRQPDGTSRLGVFRHLGPFNSAQSQVLKDYINVLNDPFEYPPVRLGWGCDVATELVSCYCRAVMQPTNGLLAAWMVPALGYGVSYTWGHSQPAASTDIWGGTKFNHYPANQSTIASNFLEARVVGGGIRVKSLAPMTSVEPLVYAAAPPSVSIDTILAQTSSGFESMLSTDVLLGSARSGVQVVLRPEDPSSYTFSTSIVQGAATNAVFPFTAPIVLVNGGDTDKVFVEWVLHFECIAGGMAAVVGEGSQNKPSFFDSLVGMFPNIETMMNVVGSYLSPAATALKVASSLAYKPTKGKNLGTWLSEFEML